MEKVKVVVVVLVLSQVNAQYQIDEVAVLSTMLDERYVKRRNYA